MTRTAFSKDEWFPVPGYGGWYEANAEGDIRSWKTSRNKKRETPLILKPCRRGGMAHCPSVVLRNENGKRENVYVHKIIASVFLGETPEGMIIGHRDNCQTNNNIYNLFFTTRKEVGKRTGGKFNRRPVLKVDKNGNIIDSYPSVKEAAEKNFIDVRQIYKHCGKQLKYPFKYQDYTFRYDR